MMPESIAAGKRVKYRNDPLPKLQSGLLKEYFINQDIVNSCALLFFSLAFISTALDSVVITSGIHVRISRKTEEFIFKGNCLENGNEQSPVQNALENQCFV